MYSGAVTVDADACIVPRHADVYRQVSSIVQSLRTDDVSHLIFTCQCLLKDRYSARHLWSSKDAGRLLELLIENYSYQTALAIVKEALVLIRRVDIANRQINISSTEEAHDHLPPLIVWLYKIYDDTRRDDRVEIIRRCKDIVSPDLESSHSLLSMFLFLIQEGKLTFAASDVSSNCELLRHVLPPNAKRLRDKVKEYAAVARMRDPREVEIPEQTASWMKASRHAPHSAPAPPIQEAGCAAAVTGLQPPYPVNPHGVTQGLCVIINNEHFTRRRPRGEGEGAEPCADREGSHVDRDALERVWSSFGFDVRVHNDLSGEEMVRTFRLYGSVDHTAYKMFVLCVLSHGERNQIYGVDSTLVPVNEMIDCITATNCPTLLDKPKLIFLQCCQGTGILRADGGHAGSAGDSQPAAAAAPRSSNILDRDIDRDMFIAYATLPGTCSWRSATTGTWFIQTLCKYLQQYGDTLCLRDIMDNVKCWLTANDGVFYDDKGTRSKVKQYAYEVSGLYRRVQLVRRRSINGR